MLTQQIQGVVIRPLEFHKDERGWLSELFRSDELAMETVPEMVYVSETNPGFSRGPHEHRAQTDLFCFFGPGNMLLYLWDARKTSSTYGAKLKILVGQSNPCAVIVPPGVVHGYKNDSETNALVFNAPNQLFAGANRECPVDEIRHEEATSSLYSFY